MEKDFLEALEEALAKEKSEFEADDIFFGLLEEFLEEGNVNVKSRKAVQAGKLVIEMSARVEDGNEDEADCVFVEWLKIGDVIYEIKDFFA